MSTNAPRQFRFTGRHMLAVILGFFGIVIGVNLTMAYAAISTFPGLNAHNSYVASQTYNTLLRDAAEQEQRGWQVGLSDCDGRVQLTLRDRDGNAIDGLKVSALAGRPASAAEDRELALMRLEDAFVTNERLAPGRWLLSLEARQGGMVVWRSTRSIVIDGGSGA